jgi:nucleotide-binding universal stress UspA family protein
MSEQRNDTSQRIVVGVDGSPSSREGLRWAVRQAELTGASVEAITSWSSPAMVGMGTPFTDADAGGGDDGGIKVAAQDMLRSAIAEAAGQSPGVAVKAEVGEGSTAQLLLDAAKGASMVVVGSRGHGGLTGTLLGSVGQTLSQHAPCPVLIIRGVE